MVISLVGNLNILILAASRVVFAMGEYGELPAGLAVIHPRHRTPVASILLTTVIMLVLALSGTFIHLLTLSTLSRLVTYFVTCTAVPVLRRRVTAPPAVFLMPAGIVVAAAGMALALWLLSTSTLREARDTAAAAAVGLSIYWVNRKLNR